MLNLHYFTCYMQFTTHKILAYSGMSQSSACCWLASALSSRHGPASVVRRARGLRLTAMSWQHNDAARIGPGRSIAVLPQSLQLLPLVLAVAAFLTLAWKV